jgi:hypothetical protein
MLSKLSNFFEGINFKDMTRENILSYLNSLRKSEDEDRLHKWIGTYNLYLTNLVRFFKCLYNPALEPRQRPKPELLNNIPKLKRKEVSIYKPTDFWTLEDDLVFFSHFLLVSEYSLMVFSRRVILWRFTNCTGENCIVPKITQTTGQCTIIRVGWHGTMPYGR